MNGILKGRIIEVDYKEGPEKETNEGTGKKIRNKKNFLTKDIISSGKGSIGIGIKHFPNIPANPVPPNHIQKENVSSPDIPDDIIFLVVFYINYNRNEA